MSEQIKYYSCSKKPEGIHCLNCYILHRSTYSDTIEDYGNSDDINSLGTGESKFGSDNMYLHPKKKALIYAVVFQEIYIHCAPSGNWCVQLQPCSFYTLLKFLQRQTLRKKRITRSKNRNGRQILRKKRITRSKNRNGRQTLRKKRITRSKNRNGRQMKHQHNVRLWHKETATHSYVSVTFDIDDCKKNKNKKNKHMYYT